MALANSLAIKLGGVTKETSEIEGGTIVRDSDGNPTGIFKDNAMELIQVSSQVFITNQKVIPLPSVEEEDRALEVPFSMFEKFTLGCNEICKFLWSYKWTPYGNF